MSAELTPAQALHREVYVTIAPHLRSVFADDTRDVSKAILAVFAVWLRAQELADRQEAKLQTDLEERIRWETWAVRCRDLAEEIETADT